MDKKSVKIFGLLLMISLMLISSFGFVRAVGYCEGTPDFECETWQGTVGFLAKECDTGCSYVMSRGTAYDEDYEAKSLICEQYKYDRKCGGLFVCQDCFRCRQEKTCSELNEEECGIVPGCGWKSENICTGNFQANCVSYDLGPYPGDGGCKKDSPVVCETQVIYRDFYGETEAFEDCVQTKNCKNLLQFDCEHISSCEWTGGTGTGGTGTGGGENWNDGSGLPIYLNDIATKGTCSGEGICPSYKDELTCSDLHDCTWTWNGGVLTDCKSKISETNIGCTKVLLGDGEANCISHPACFWLEITSPGGCAGVGIDCEVLNSTPSRF